MKKKVLITGDIAIDWFEITKPPDVSVLDLTKENWKRYNNIARLSQPGGALLMSDIMKSFKKYEVLGPELKKNCEEIKPDDIIISEALLTYNKDFKTYFISDIKGFRGPLNGHPPGCLNSKQNIVNYQLDAAGASLVIIDDPGNGFRDCESLFPKNIGRETPVILKMNRPLLKNRCYKWLKEQVSNENITVIISADDLRKMKEVKISHGLSWEKTALDFSFHIKLNQELMELSECANLIVLFNTDGAILYKGEEGGKSILFYDTKRLEYGFMLEHPYKVMGITSVFTSFIADSILKKGISGLEDNIIEGLKGARLHYLLGYEVENDKIDLPINKIHNPDFKIDKNVNEYITNYSRVIIPKPTKLDNPDPRNWTILDELTSNTRDIIAENIVKYGEDNSLNKVPEIQFGNKLKTLDRAEIESYSSIQKLIREFLANKKTEHPLCLAVFGYPGSGKSFAVKQIADRIDSDNVEVITINLSQLEKYTDLIPVFHKTRDICLSGKTPLVFFDEFDSNSLEWLKFFLAPMQDGVFIEGESLYHIGKAIFVFAGGVFDTFEKFSSNDHKNNKTLKLNDFISRLRGFIDIMGPDTKTNISDKLDEAYIIRRAKLLRIAFKSIDTAREMFDNDGGQLNIDDSVLRAMLKVPKYKHGNRSMKAILQMSRLAGQKVFNCALLPTKEQLDLHVDSETFHFLIEKERFTNTREEEQEIVYKIAKTIHETYISNRMIKGEPTNVPENFDQLPEEKRFSNIDQAEDIPRKLKSIFIGIRPIKISGYPNITIISDDEIEKLAELEQERWCREQKLFGWKYGIDRNKFLKHTPFLVPYDQLKPEIKEYNREAIIAIPLILFKAGLELYRMEEKEEIADIALIEKLARAIHQHYLKMREKESEKPKNDPSLKEYEELSDELKFSNINSACHIPTKLLKIGYALRPLKKGKVPEIKEFTTEEIETMSRLEHERWNWEKRFRGWIYGKEKDNENKITPYLTNYDTLSDKIKEYDKQSVRLIPELLDMVGYEIYKLK